MLDLKFKNLDYYVKISRDSFQLWITCVSESLNPFCHLENHLMFSKLRDAQEPWFIHQVEKTLHKIYKRIMNNSQILLSKYLVQTAQGISATFL